MRTIYILGILVLLALAAPPSPAHAGGVVTVCDEAHLLAALVGGGTVTFACSGTITLSNTITIAADTTIDGGGQDVTISGNNAVQVFEVYTAITVQLLELSIADGHGIYGGAINNQGGTVILHNANIIGNHSTFVGGGIYTWRGTVMASNSTFYDNSALYGYGGGIDSAPGGSTLNLDNCTFIGNSAMTGGGIHFNSDRVDDTLTITDSNFSNNNAGKGGAIYNEAYRATVNVSGSTFSDNHAGNEYYGYYGEGGGIFNRLGKVIIDTSTFTGNSAFGTGGGIRNSDGTVIISNSTFMGNAAIHNGTGLGGGIYTDYTGSVTVDNSTFANNRADYPGSAIMNNWSRVTLENTIVVAKASGENCYGTITDGGGNLSYFDATCPGINADPKLGPLQDNGGPTWTMALGEGSAAIDAGVDAICAAAPVNGLDQRGIARPWGAHCDIGAVEQVPIKKLWLPVVQAR